MGMYILTDGKNYVMRDPVKNGRYIKTTSPIQASQFTFKQARSLLNSKKQINKWMKDYHCLEADTRESYKGDITYKGNGGVFLGVNDFDFDESILDEISKEADNIMGLIAWDKTQLDTYEIILNNALSYYDSAISDIEHAIEDKRPPAHIRTKIFGVLQDVREKHTKIKCNIRYIKVLQNAIINNWDLSRIKLEISRVKYEPYKGRTEYYDKILELIG